MKPPERGDLVWIDFDPRPGHEQSGRRPALVLTPCAYNRASRLAIFCPVRPRAKGYEPVVAVFHLHSLAVGEAEHQRKPLLRKGVLHRFSGHAGERNPRIQVVQLRVPRTRRKR